MLREIKIENFRSFKSFELRNLGRLNLLVGTNNSGKTSVLEAIQLLCSRNNLEPLRDSMVSRGEYSWDERKRYRELDVCHLFHGHQIEPGSEFSVLGTGESRLEKLTAKVGLRPLRRLYEKTSDNGEQLKMLDDYVFEDSPNDFNVLDLTIKWLYGNEQDAWERPLSSDGKLTEDYIRRLRPIGRAKGLDTKTQFVTSSALTSERTIELFEQIVLTPEENLVQEALQVIEPRIERIASLGSERFRRSEARGGFVVNLSDGEQRVPIGSMGDGIWRMLGLALSTVSSTSGVLFVDEIDTGLHFTAMSDMWKLIWETAKRLDVQVFATTHSSDCWTSLATIVDQDILSEDGITIQRIERDQSVSVAFSESEIVIAAKRGIEVR
ncbi:AAA family ATPase [Leptolyngbya sp. KIOST-1]|uniref:AAA family ATPase n=1 Tax=Leptolyngbya sp. KIOST-1 TaxID=1229172 RepID=UPI00056C1C40|nr:ATP-binding protein [Leptolyngbya sp. KIOST-1]